MSPFQHGEVYVLEDGAETDLDLGHYERFTSGQALAAEQPDLGPDLRERDPEGAPRRLPRQDRAGDPARDERDQGADLRRRQGRRRPHHGDRRHDGRHRGPAVPRGHAPVRARDRAQGRGLHPRDARALPAPPRASSRPSPPSSRVAKLREIGIQPHVLVCRCDHPLDHRPARQAEPVLQRAGEGGHRVPRRRQLDLRAAARAAEGGDGRAGARPARASSCRRPKRNIWVEIVRRILNPAARGHDRRRRQVHRAAGRLQVRLRVDHPRRHRQQLQGQRARGSTPRTWRRRAGLAAAPAASTASWCRADSATAAPRARSRRRATRARTAMPYFGLCLGLQIAVDRVRAQRPQARGGQQHRVRSAVRRTRSST